MTREIKFRAWDKDRKIIIKDEDIDHIDFKKKIVYWYDIEGSYDENGDTEWRQVQAVSANIELMQFTGLKDKNGKEIYEGDVFKGRDTFGSPHPDDFHSQRFIGKVIWDLCGFRVEYPLGKCDHNYSDFTDIDNIEIIGNIYENPELINN